MTSTSSAPADRSNSPADAGMTSTCSSEAPVGSGWRSRLGWCSDVPSRSSSRMPAEDGIRGIGAFPAAESGWCRRPPPSRYHQPL